MILAKSEGSGLDIGKSEWHKQGKGKGKKSSEVNTSKYIPLIPKE